MHSFDYSQTDMVNALKKVGLKAGDAVFTHSNIGYFGRPESGSSLEAAFYTIYHAFKEVLGNNGTLIVPTFTYSFTKNELFDVFETPSKCGLFSEMLRRLPEAVRSEDPMFSVAGVGKLSKELLTGVASECFGKDSFWERFLSAGGTFCNMNLDAGSTFIHYVEKCLDVPYRQDRVFSGKTRKGGSEQERSIVFYSQDLNVPETAAAFEMFDCLARQHHFVRESKVGRGTLVAISARDTYALIKKALSERPLFLTQRGKEPAILDTRQK